MGGTAGGFAIERGSSIYEQARKEAEARGVDPKDEEAMRAILREKSPEFSEKANWKGVGTAGTDAALNVATMGIAGRQGRALTRAADKIADGVRAGTISAAKGAEAIAVIEAKNAARNTLGQKALRGSGVVGAEMAGEGFSEGVGQKLAYEEVDPQDVIFEAIAGGGTGLAMAGGHKAYDRMTGAEEAGGTEAAIERARTATPDPTAAPVRQTNSPLSNAANAANAAAPVSPNAGVAGTPEFDQETANITNDKVAVIAERDQISQKIANIQGQLQRTPPESDEASLLKNKLQAAVAQRDVVAKRLETLDAFDQPAGHRADPVAESDAYFSRILAAATHVAQDPESMARLSPQDKASALQHAAILRNPTLPETVRRDSASVILNALDALAESRADAADLRQFVNEERPMLEAARQAAQYDARLDNHIARAPQGPTSAFADVADFEKFMGEERSDLAQRRAAAVDERNAPVQEGDFARSTPNEMPADLMPERQPKVVQKPNLDAIAAKYKAKSQASKAAPAQESFPPIEQPTHTAQLQEANDPIARTSPPVGGIESPTPSTQAGISEVAATQKPEQQIFVNGNSVDVTRNGGFVQDAGQFSPVGKRALQAIADTGSKELAAEHLRKQGDAEAADALGTEAGQVVVKPVGSEPPVKVRTVYGDYVYVSPDDMSGSRPLLKTLNKDGSPKTGDNALVHRDNLDPTGDKQQAKNAALPPPNIISLSRKTGDVAYRSEVAAQQGARKHGVTETHEVIPASEVSPGTQGFVLRRKAESNEQQLSGDEQDGAIIAAKHAEVPAKTPVSNESFEHAGSKIYPLNVSVGGKEKSVWAVQSIENVERGRKGDRQIGGDKILDSRDEAIKHAEFQAEAARKTEALNAMQAAKEEEEKAKLLSRKTDNADGFTEGMAPNVAELARKALDKQYRFADGAILSARDRVNALLEEGRLEVSTLEDPKIKPMSRAQFNRATQREQDAHEKKMLEAGNVTTYLVSGSELGKTAYGYAKFILAKQKDSSNEKSQEQPSVAEAPPATVETAEPLSRHEMNLRKFSTEDDRDGDVMLEIGRFAPFSDAVAVAKLAIESGDMRPVPAQLHFVLGLAMRDVDRVLSAALGKGSPGSSIQPETPASIDSVAERIPEAPLSETQSTIAEPIAKAVPTRTEEVSSGFEVTRSGAKVLGGSPAALAEIAKLRYPKGVSLRKDGIVIATKDAEGARNLFPLRREFYALDGLHDRYAQVVADVFPDGVTVSSDVVNSHQRFPTVAEAIENYRQGYEGIDTTEDVPTLREAVADNGSAEALHVERGVSEGATPVVVEESLEKAAQKTPLSLKEAHQWLLGGIDKAIAAAPNAVEFDEVFKTKGMTDEDRFIVFDVPGDGKFKVLNFKERLEGFRETVEKAAGFKPVKKPAVHKTPMERVTGATISDASIREFLQDGDYLTASALAEQVGRPLIFGSYNPKHFNRPVVYTDVKPFAPKGYEGVAMVSAKEVTQKGAGSWSVIELSTGQGLVGTKGSRADVENALLKRATPEKMAAAMASHPKRSQAELSAEWRAWAEKEEVGVDSESAADRYAREVTSIEGVTNEDDGKPITEAEPSVSETKKDEKDSKPKNVTVEKLSVGDKIAPKKGSGWPASYAGSVAHIKDDPNGGQLIRTNGSGRQYMRGGELEKSATADKGEDDLSAMFDAALDEAFPDQAPTVDPYQTVLIKAQSFFTVDGVDYRVRNDYSQVNLNDSDPVSVRSVGMVPKVSDMPYAKVADAIKANKEKPRKPPTPQVPPAAPREKIVLTEKEGAAPEWEKANHEQRQTMLDAAMTKLAKEDAAPRASKAAASAAKNAGMGMADVAKGLSALFKPKPGTLGMGLPFDDETYAAAKPYFMAGIQHFKQAGADVAAMMKALVVNLRDQFGFDRETLTNMKPYIVRFMEDAKAGKITYDESTTTAGEADDTPSPGSAPSLDNAMDEGQRPHNNYVAARGVKPARYRHGRSNDGVVRGDRNRPNVPANEGEALGNGRGASDIQDGTNDALAGNVQRVSADYRPGFGGLTRQGSWFDSASRNVDLIELAIKIDQEGRNATPEEQALLAKYVGFGAGAIRNVLFPVPPAYLKERDPNRLIWPTIVEARWKPLAERIEALPRTWQQSILQSSQYAHYTSEGIIRSIWSAVQRLGFTGGKIFEPGTGIGSFAMLMPDSVRQTSKFTGVEFDAPTALIARLLSPDQQLQHGDFIKRKFPKNFFDVNVGNPPFSQTKIVGDPEYAKNGFMLHDFFFAKGIDLVRPGGLQVFVTSKGTMDKLTDKARKFLSDRADLIGAIRLPSTAFEGNAGTSVVTDVIFLRKRLADEAMGGQSWSQIVPVETPDGPVMINEYFAKHPEMVLGQNRISGYTDDLGRRINSNGRGGNAYTVVSYDTEPGELDAKFAQAIERLPESVYSVMEQSPESLRDEVGKVDFDPSVKREGVIYVGKDGAIMRVNSGVGVPLESFVKVSDKDKAWYKGYAGIRDLVQAARAAQFSDGDWAAALKKLNKAYDSFRKTHGPIMDFTVTTRKSTDEEGNIVETESRRYKNRRLYLEDYDSAMVTALEDINEDGAIVKAPFLTGRTIGKPVTVEVKSVGDALAVSLNEIGVLNIDDIARRIKLDRAEVIEALGSQIYQDPDASQWVLSDEYLSGDVVAKLEEAEQAAHSDPRFLRNVEALKEAQPEKLGPSQISAKLGASWIPAAYVNEFSAEIGAGEVSFDFKTESWQVAGGNKRSERSVSAEYGTADRSPSEILEAVLNSRPITIKVTIDKKTVTDVEATAAANEVAKKIKDKFKGWVWTDAERATELVESYNKQFNNIAARKFDGSHLTLPGVSLRFKLHPHQLRTIWRQIQTGNTYLAHAVGAGKTIEMIAGGMEQKRLGLIKKPIYVVPNHMLEQFSNEFMELYPLANIMVADDQNFSAERRKAFVAAATLNAPDAIIITHSAFKRIGVTEESVAPIRDEILTDLELELSSAAKDNDSRVRRSQLEQQIEAVKQRFDKIVGASGKDSTLKFEDIGADFIYADEAHTFRKLDFHTAQSIKGIDPNGSQAAMDMYVKTRILERRNPGRSFVFASGTPVTNTMGELFSIMRFFSPKELDMGGVSTFDSWSRQFGEAAHALEQNAAGRYEMVERFAKFDNVPELMSRVRQFMDVLTSENLGSLVKRPDIKGRKPNLNVVPSNPALEEYMQGELASRIEASKAWKPSPGEKGNPDPMVSIISDGRLAAIDPRFFGGKLEGDSIITVMGDKVAANYHAIKNNVYYDKDGSPEKIKGGTQIVFYNLGFGEGVQERRGFNARDALTKRLVGGGIPRAEIYWFDDADSDAKKEKVFQDMRSGKLKVLIGSAKKMGTGVNVQKRLAVLHYQDPPWFPSDVEQPHGRIIRQGNQNKEVAIEWYTTKGTYQSTMWQMVARKQRFIDQAFSGDKSVRSMSDMSEASQFEQAAAVASGDPRAIQLAGLKQDVERFEQLQRAHASEQVNVRSAIRGAEWSIEQISGQIKMLDQAFKAIGESYLSFSGGKVGSTEYAKMGEFGQALKEAFNKEAVASADGFMLRDKTIARIGNKIKLVMESELDTAKRPNGNFILAVDFGGISRQVARGSSFGADVDAAGLARRVMNQINSVETDLREAQRQLSARETERVKLRKKFGAPFEYQQELAEKYGDLKRLEQELKAEGEELSAEAKASIGKVADPVRSASEGADVSITAKFSRGNGGARPLASELTLAADQSDAQALNDALAENFNDEGWRNAYASTLLSDDDAKKWAGIQQGFLKGFGRRVVQVSPTGVKGDLFAGVRIGSNPDVLYVTFPNKRNLIAVAGHELYHDLADRRPDLHQWFRDQALPYVQNYQKYHDQETALLENGERYEDEVLFEELLADFTGDALSDPVFLQQLADANPGKFKALLTAVKQWLNKLIARLQGNGSEEFVSDVKALRDHLAQALQAYADGKRIDEVLPGLAMSGDQATVADKEYQAVEAKYRGTPLWMKAPNGQPTKLSAQQWVQVRTPSFKQWFGDWEGIAHRESLDSMPPVEIDYSDFGDRIANPELFEKNAKAAYSAIKRAKNVIDGSEIQFVMTGYRKLLSHSASASTLEIIAGLQEVMEKAIPIYSEPHKSTGKENESTRAWHTYAARAMLDGEPVYVKLVVREDVFGKRTIDAFHDATVTSQEEVRAANLRSSTPLSMQEETAWSGAPDKDKLRHWYAEVNPSRVSKVVDANGEPLVVTHATNSAEFPVFRKGERAGLSGRGIYFSPDGVAIWGKNIISAFLSVKNPMTKENAPSSVNNGGMSAVDPDVFDNFPQFDGVMLRRDEITVKEPGQIKSAIGNNGDFSGNNPDIRFSRTRDTAPNAPSDSTSRASTVKDWLKNQFAQQRGWMMGALSLDQISEIYGKTLTQVADFAKTVEKMDTDKQKIADSADKIIEQWRKLNTTDADRLADVMHQSTLMQYDPDKYDVFSDSYDPQRVDLHTQFTALPAAAQQLYRDARDQHQKTLEKVRDGLANRAERASSMGAKVAAEIRLEFDKYLAEGPYFPLARFGDFIMISKRGEERIVEAFESVAQRKKVQKQRQAEGFTTNLKRSKDYSRSRDGVAGAFTEKVLKHIQALDMPAEEKSALMDTLNQIAISSLPDASYRKHFAHRKGVRGFSNDAMRAFANSQFHAAHHIARINHADQLSKALDDLNTALQEDQSGDTTEPTEVYNELSKRLDLILNPNTHPIAAAMGSVGFVMSIGGSVASGVTNLTQTPMVTFPMLGARYGFDSAAAQLTKASKDYFGGKWNKMSGWVMADNESLSVDERKALTSLQDMGYIDLTQAHDLAGVANTNAASSKASFVRARAMKIIGWTFHVPEVFNRQVTALATYRLAVGKGMTHEQALQEAVRLIKQSHFSYSNSNRTRFMNGNLARVLTMFKQFSQNMTYLLWRNTYLALKGESPEVKREARRLLMGLAATHFAFAGALGLPLGVFGISTVLLPLLAMGMGDDDEPWDWEDEFRNMLAESFGTDVGEAIAKGPMRTLVPWIDFSSRVGMGDLWWRKPNKEMEGRDEAEYWLLTLLGPVAGYVGTMGTAAKAFGEGKIERGVEAMMPKMIAAPLKSIRYATEGVKSMKGDDLGLELDAGDILAQALGWTPSSVSEMYEARNAIKNREHLLTMRRSEIINQWAAAKTAGDFEAQQEAMAMAKTFSEKNPSMKVTPGTLVKSMAAKARNAQQIKNGVYLPKSREALREEGAFADVN